MDTFANFAKVTVSQGYDAAATSIVLTTGHGARLPAEPFNATWWNVTDYPDASDDANREVVRVTNVSTDTLTVTRAQEGTSATTKNTGGKTYKLVATLTALTLTELASHLPRSGTGSPEAAVTAPVGVSYLDTANEALWIKKTGTGNTGWIQLIA